MLAEFFRILLEWQRIHTHDSHPAQQLIRRRQ
jgi:hypothetical protein